MALNFLLKRSGTADKRPNPASMALGELDLNYDAETGGVFYKDSNGDVVKVGSAQVSATAPNATPAGSTGNSLGEFWYDTGTSELKMWDGTDWVATGGGGGGIDPSILTAKGDLITATAASTPTALPVGTDGQVLTACSACSSGLVWATPTGGSSPVETYNQVITVNDGEANTLLFNWEAQRGTGESYLLSGNVSAMAFVTISDDVNGSNPVAWAQIMISSIAAQGLSQVIASDTTGGIITIGGYLYPEFTDTSVIFSPQPNVTVTTNYLMNLSLNWFGGFGYNPTIYGTPAT